MPAAVRRRAESGERDAEHRRVAVGFVHVLGVDDHLDRDTAPSAPQKRSAG